VNPVGIVVILKLPQLLLQIAPVPEKSLVLKLPPDGANELLDNGMGNQRMGNGFNFINFPNPQIGSPSVVAEQGVMIRAEMVRSSLPECGLIEHLAKRGAIDIACEWRITNLPCTG